MIRRIAATLILLSLGAHADQLQLRWRDGTTGEWSPVPLTIVPGEFLSFDGDGYPIMAAGGDILQTEIDTINELNAIITDGNFLSEAAAAAAYQPIDAATSLLGQTISLAEMASISTTRLLGRYTSGSGIPEEIALSAEMTVAGGALAPTSAVTLDTEWNTAAKINTATTDDDFATLTGTQTLTGKTLTSPALNTPTITGPTYASASLAALDIDWATASAFYKTLAANSTFTFSNLADGRTISVALTNTASNYTVTWPTVSWAGGVAPTQTTGAHTDVYTFIRINGTIYGSAVQNF